MKKLLVILFVLSQCALAQESVELTIHFEDGSDIPSMPEIAMLDEIAQHPNAEQLRFWVVGHTDDKGSEKFNVELSKERTRKVTYHLLLSGIKPYNILFEHHGEDCPVTENEDETSRALNRRVEILISNVGVLEEPGFAGRYRPEMFQRPLTEILPDKEVFVLENQESNCIETASGSMIDVPPMAFMDAYGRPIGGAVELTYEEMNNPFSVFLSGINMKGDECQSNSHLETAGMFSINATHRGKPVEIRQDRPVQIDLASNSMDPNFNFLFMNPSTETWNNLGNAAINEHDAELISIAENLSSAVQEYLNQTDYLSPTIASRTTLEARFQNTEYLANRPIASYYRFLRDGDENEREQFEKEWKKAASFQAKVLPRNPNNSEETVHFTVQKHSQFGQHPEYFFFNFHTWEYAGDLSRAKVEAMLQDKRFHDIRVRYNALNDSVSIELKDLDGIVKLPVRKITIENMSAELQKRMFGEFAPAFQEWRERKENRSFEDRYTVYDDLLEEQENRIRRKADKFDRRSKTVYQKELDFAWKQAQRSMTESEKMMSQTNWVSYCNGISNKLEEYYARQNGRNTITRTIALDRMGIYNCARPIDQSTFQQVKPRFVLSNGKAIAWKTCYVFDENVNSVIAYNGSDIEEIGLDPSSMKMMMVTDTDGNIYQLNESEIVAMNMGKVTQRIMHISAFDSSIRSLDEMREMLGLGTE
ncbi:MAG: OmpA family protein [Flavobacteriales bacterium]|nr:OmpA family protein [Flavobacteriales bacterium]